MKLQLDSIQMTPMSNQTTTVDSYEDGTTTTTTTDNYKLYVGTFALPRKIQQKIQNCQALKFRFYTDLAPYTFRLHTVLISGNRDGSVAQIEETCLPNATSRLSLLQELIRISSKAEYDVHAKGYRVQ